MFSEVETIFATEEGLRVGIIVYRDFLPPVTLIFEKRLGANVQHIKDVLRAERPGQYCSISEEVRAMARRRAIEAIKKERV